MLHRASAVRSAARLVLPLLAVCASAAGAAAQDVSIDFGTDYGAPGAGYAAAGLAGGWNALQPPVAAPAGLLDLAGQPAGLLVRTTGGFLPLAFDNPATSGDDAALLDDGFDTGGPGSVVEVQLSGLPDGDWLVLTYAFAPDNAAFRTRVEVPGSAQPAALVGGAWSGAHAEGLTYARHEAVVAGGSLVVRVSAANGFGTLNGLQLVRLAPARVVCSGDGGGAACPCGNTGAPGAGCLNSLGTSGLLAASGVASVAHDTLQLAASGLPTSFALYFQGTSSLAGGNGAVFGDGLRCAGGAVLRLATRQSVGGGSQLPAAGDPPLSVLGGAQPGALRTYQTWYRNGAAYCQPETFNLTNGLELRWAP